MAVQLAHATAVQRLCNGGATTVQPAPAIAELSGFSFDQLRGELAADRGKPVPRRTLYHWMSACGIERDANGLYELEDLQALKSLVAWLKRPGASIDRFTQLLSQWRQANAN
jgi:hypothetical protein